VGHSHERTEKRLKDKLQGVCKPVMMNNVDSHPTQALCRGNSWRAKLLRFGDLIRRKKTAGVNRRL
jgi:hypothetical protein